MKKQKTQSDGNNTNNKISLDSIINDSLKNLKEIIDVNTIVGEEVITEDGSVIIPISKIIVGYVAGGGEYTTNEKKPAQNYPFSGGSGAGFTIVPIGFLAGKNGNLTFISTKSDTKYDELINLTNRSLKLILDNLTKKTDK